MYLCKAGLLLSSCLFLFYRLSAFLLLSNTFCFLQKYTRKSMCQYKVTHNFYQRLPSVPSHQLRHWESWVRIADSFRLLLPFLIIFTSDLGIYKWNHKKVGRLVRNNNYVLLMLCSSHLYLATSCHCDLGSWSCSSICIFSLQIRHSIHM